MAELASVASLILAVVMAHAGQSKLRSHAQTTESFDQLGLPQPSVLAWIVPAAELVIALALVLWSGWGGVAAFVLLAAFTAFLLSILRSGRVVSCGCFGSTSTEPISSSEIGRNGVLLGLAALASTTSSLTTPDLPAVVTVTVAGLSAMTVVQLFSLRSQIGSLFRIELAGEALPPNGPGQ